MASLALGALYVASAALRSSMPEPSRGAAFHGSLRVAAAGKSPTVIVRKRSDGRLAVVDGSGAVKVVSTRCRRVHFRAGHALCLREDASRLYYDAHVLDDRLAADQARIRLTGLPSRTRLSPDGRIGAVTTFASGHSYASDGQFSTRTILIDVTRAKEIADLERFTVLHHGRRVDSPDANFWGVTFANDDDRFYATLRTRGRTWLIEGSVRDRRAHTLVGNVECPSLSPDGQRIVYKRLVGGPGEWRLYVMNLRTLASRPLAEGRVVDDQVEWLDDQRVLYAVGRDIWTVRADGRGRPSRFMANAESPSVVR